MGTVGLVLIAMIAVSVAVGIAMWRGVASTEPWAKYLQSVITITAILLAGYLYFVERRSKPHAEVAQTVEAVGLGDGIVAMEASVIVKNLGTQLLKIDQVASRLQLIDIHPLGVGNLPELRGRKYWKAVGKNGREVFKGPELRWRQLRFYFDRVAHEIEPGESDLITISFVFRCPRARHVRIATEIGKPGTRALADNRRTDPTNALAQTPNAREAGATTTPAHSKNHPDQLVWKARTMVDLEPICATGGKKQEGQGDVQPTIKT